MNKYILFISLLLILSCKESIQTVTTEIKKSDKNIPVKHKAYVNVNTSSAEKIKLWKEHHDLTDFLKRYENTSPDEALDNSFELKELTKALKDSLTIVTFKTPAFKTRLNVLENEVLRLLDMSDIPAIKTTEVNDQVDKIFLVFSSLNQKINTIYNQQRFEEELGSSSFFLSEIKKTKEEEEDEEEVSTKKKKDK